LTFSTTKEQDLAGVEPLPDTRSEAPPKKKRCIATKVNKGFKKDFDVPPSSSTLLNHPPSSQKSTPFKTMIADWWLQTHTDAKTLEGAAWLVGFHDRLEDEDLHPTDKDYLKELVAWHKEKASDK
jgi:hypothetical protein